MQRPAVLTVAGSDPSGGAGLQSDLAVFATFGCHGFAAIAGLTVQDSRGVRAVSAVADRFVAAQLEALFADRVPAAAKTGMLAGAEAVHAVVSAFLAHRGVPLVVDPVFASAGGVRLADDDAERATTNALIPIAALVTPNAIEAASLTGIVVGDLDGALAAARRLLQMGARAALVKGGHLGGETVTDVFVESGHADPVVFERPRDPLRPTGPRDGMRALGRHRRGTRSRAAAARRRGTRGGLGPRGDRTRLRDGTGRSVARPRGARRGDARVSRVPRIAVVGTGPVGRALASTYAAGGGEVTAIVSRRADRAAEFGRRCGVPGSADLAGALAADVVLVAVPDRVLGDVAAHLAAIPSRASVLCLHTSGTFAGSVLAAAGRRAGSLHPLQSFPDLPDEGLLAARVAGTHWFHEGDGADEAAAMVAVWRGTFHRLAAGGKVLYHAGAAMLSNHTVALFDAALRAFETAGVPRAEAHEPLAALLAGTSANLASAGVPAALTGPIARGDVDTVRRHLDALRDAAPELLESYVAMARRTLVVARAKGSLDAAAAKALTLLLSPPIG